MQLQAMLTKQSEQSSGLGKRIDLSYHKILTYCEEEGLLDKYRNRSWPHKMKKQQCKKYGHSGESKSKIPDDAAK